MLSVANILFIFLNVIYRSIYLSVIYIYIYIYIYINYIINIFDTLYIICIDYMILFLATIFPVRCLSLILYYRIIIYHCKFSLHLFSTCIITPAYLFVILGVSIPLGGDSQYNYFVLHFLFHFQELVSNINRLYTN